MTTIIYDSTFEGLLTVVFEIYERKLQQVKLHKDEWHNGALFEEVLTIVTDQPKVRRVLKGLKERLSPDGLKRLYITHLAEMQDSDNTLLGYIRHVFDSEINIEEDYGNKYVLRLSALTKMIGRERHRMEAFIRFQKLSDGTFYAAIEPDFNVLPLLIKHFRDRYADQKWIIYDLKRKYGIYYDLDKVEYIEVEFSADVGNNKLPSIYFEDERLYQHLWKNYFNSVNIPSRKNMKLHLRHIPKRYWKHLTEKI
ncbi:MAG TPA: TIGR03915 family putative DNA repair protein [Mucilaginibacter sp.]|jgi:probable DNA metabolism protein|nr:TIGR03915 family putative DNA repair protein [Mucilaginibacter sp.]